MVRLPCQKKISQAVPFLKSNGKGVTILPLPKSETMTILDQIKTAKQLLADPAANDVELAHNLLCECVYYLDAGYPMDGSIESIRRNFQRQSEVAKTLNQLIGK